MLVDFGDIQVFEGVTTYPAIVVMDRADSPDPQAPVRFLALGQDMPESLAAEFRQHADTLPQGQLGNDSWRLESDVLARLREKLTKGHPTLKEVYGSPLYGIKTGLERAFVVDRATRDRLIAEDPNSAQLLKPFLEGRDLKKWRIEPQDLWLIYIPKRRIAIADFPAIERHLGQFKTALEKRATRQEWFELQQGQADYETDFQSAKVLYPEISQGSKFALDEAGFYPMNKLFYLATTDWFLVALLNFRIIWTYLFGICSPLQPRGTRGPRGKPRGYGRKFCNQMGERIALAKSLNFPAYPRASRGQLLFSGSMKLMVAASLFSFA